MPVSNEIFARNAPVREHGTSPPASGAKHIAWRLMVFGLTLLSYHGVQAANYALIMTIGNYADPRAHLPGIDLDAKNALRIAESMGVPRQNQVSLKDADLTSEGIRAAFDRMKDRIERGDNVFVYYSGHGTQMQGDGGKCAEGMVAEDMKAYVDTDLQRSLLHLAEKAGQVVMMNDSCFSGGQASVRSLNAKGGSVMVAKAWKMSSHDEGYTCGEPINMKLSRNLVPAAKQAGANLLYIAASRDNEVSYASAAGSVATNAWLSCISTGADPLGTGVLTGQEIRACAQHWLDQHGNNQHITLIGNDHLPITFLGRESGHVTDAPIGALAGAPRLGRETLERLQSAASPAFQVDLRVSRSNLRIGHDFLTFDVSSNAGGYLNVLQVGSDGVTFNQVFPNDRDTNNHLLAGQTVTLPRPGWALRSGGPVGTSYLIAVVSESPRDWSQGFHAEGPFRSASGSGAARNLVIEAVGSAQAGPGRYGASPVIPVSERD